MRCVRCGEGVVMRCGEGMVMRCGDEVCEVW